MMVVKDALSQTLTYDWFKCLKNYQTMIHILLEVVITTSINPQNAIAVGNVTVLAHWQTINI